MEEKLFEVDNTVERTLRWVYVPIIKNAFEFDNERFDVMLENYVDYIPFYEEQNFDKEMRYKVAKLLNMFNLAKYFGVIDDYDIEDLDKEELYLLINQEARSNTKEYTSTNLIKNKIFEDFVEWYNKQDIDFIELDLKDEEYTIRYWNFSADVNTEELFKDEHQWKFNVTPWLILKPNHDYSYLKDDAIEHFNLYYELANYDITVSYVILKYYLLGVHQIFNSLAEIDGKDFKPLWDFDVEFEVDGEKKELHWKPYKDRFAPDNYCINVKGLYLDLVASYDDLDNEYGEIDYEYVNNLYNEIIEDHIRSLEGDFDFHPLVLGRSGGYFGFQKEDFKIFDTIIIKVNNELIEETISGGANFSIQDFRGSFLKEIDDMVSDMFASNTDEDMIEIEDFEFDDEFIEFNQSVYKAIKALSSGPELRNWEEYEFWLENDYDNSKLEEFRKKKLSE